MMRLRVAACRRRLLGHPPQNDKFGCECCLPKASSLPLICGTSAGPASSSMNELITIQRRHIEKRRGSSRQFCGSAWQMRRKQSNALK
jgi:hypothetical protein